MKGVVAIIPAKNEAATVRNVVCSTVSFCPVFLVNDHSQDCTANIAREAGARILDLAECTGYGAALIVGIRAALAEGYGTILTLDADGAHDPRDLGSLLSAHASCGADLTLGDRFASCAPGSMPSAKYWANYFASTIVNRLLGTHLRDVACGFRVIEVALARHLIREESLPGFGFTLQVLQIATARRARIASSPVAVHYGAEELHATTQRELLDALLAVISHLPEQSSQVSVIRAMATLVSGLAPISLRVGQELLCLHPVHSVYVFQRHPPELSQPRFGTVIDLDAAYERDIWPSDPVALAHPDE